MPRNSYVSNTLVFLLLQSLGVWLAHRCNNMKLESLIDEAEQHLIVTSYEDAETSAKDALQRSLYQQNVVELQDRACVVLIQALYETGRYDFHAARQCRGTCRAAATLACAIMQQDLAQLAEESRVGHELGMMAALPSAGLPAVQLCCGATGAP